MNGRSPLEELQVRFNGLDDDCRRLREDRDGIAEYASNLERENAALREVLAELIAATEATIPFYEEGIEAQNAWSARRTAAYKAARAILEGHSAGGESALAPLLRRARPYVEAGSVAEDSLLEEIDAALSEKATVFQTTEPHREDSGRKA